MSDHGKGHRPHQPRKRRNFNRRRRRSSGETKREDEDFEPAYSSPSSSADEQQPSESDLANSSMDFSDSPEYPELDDLTQTDEANQSLDTPRSSSATDQSSESGQDQTTSSPDQPSDSCSHTDKPTTTTGELPGPHNIQSTADAGEKSILEDQCGAVEESPSQSSASAVEESQDLHNELAPIGSRLSPKKRRGSHDDDDSSPGYAIEETTEESGVKCICTVILPTQQKRRVAVRLKCTAALVLTAILLVDV